MANELISNLRLTVTSGVALIDFNQGRLVKDFVPLKVYRARLLVTTSEITVAHGVAAPRFCILYNNDDTNFVEAGTSTADYPIYLRPASIATQFEIGPGKTNLYLKADTASCYVEVLVF